LIPAQGSLFHFEKVSKRMHLDIASVNTAIHILMQKDLIMSASLSAGGVSAIPLFLEETSKFLVGRKISIELIGEAIEMMQNEVSPISDARGSADYKRLLLAQLIKAHFIKLFPLLDHGRVLNV